MGGDIRGGAGAPAAPEPGLWPGGSICLFRGRGATPLEVTGIVILQVIFIVFALCLYFV